MRFIDEDGKERHKGWIYEIEFVGEGEYQGWSYIGQSRNQRGWERRVLDHFMYPNDTYMDNVCQKYDPSNFRAHLVAEYVCDTEEELIAKLNDCEPYFVMLFGTLKDWGHGFNLMAGGNAQGVSEDTRRKNSESNKKRYEDPENRRKTSDAVKSALASPEMRKKISERTKAALASPEYRRKMSEHSKGKNAKPCQLLDLESGFVYDFESANACSEFIQIDIHNLYRYKTKPCKGRWIFIPSKD